MPKVILVVDDDPVHLTLMARALASGYEVLAANRARRALEILATLPSVSLVVTDVVMPDMDGVELVRIIRASSVHPDVPILFLTAATASGKFEEGLAAGGDEVMIKPFKIPSFLAKVASLAR